MTLEEFFECFLTPTPGSRIPSLTKRGEISGRVIERNAAGFETVGCTVS